MDLMETKSFLGFWYSVEPISDTIYHAIGFLGITFRKWKTCSENAPYDRFWKDCRSNYRVDKRKGSR